MGNYFSSSNTESITIINEIDHVHVVMSSDSTHENKNINEEKNIYNEQELNVGSASASDAVIHDAVIHDAVIHDAVIHDAVNIVTSTICKKKNVKKNKNKNKNKK